MAEQIVKLTCGHTTFVDLDPSCPTCGHKVGSHDKIGCLWTNGDFNDEGIASESCACESATDGSDDPGYCPTCGALAIIDEAGPLTRSAA